MLNKWITLKDGTMVHKKWEDVANFDINSELWDKETTDFIEDLRNFCIHYDNFKTFMRDDHGKIGFNMPYGILGQFIQERKNNKGE